MGHSKYSQRPVSSSAGWREGLSAEVGSGKGTCQMAQKCPGLMGLHIYVLLT